MMRARHNRVQAVIWIIIPFMVVALLWQFVASLRLFPDYLFPSPLSVARDFVDRALRSQALFFHIKESLLRLFVGYAIGIAGGLALGFAMGLNRTVANFFGPLFDFTHAIPGVTWLPLVILWFGIGFKAVVFILVLVVFFPVLYGTLTGIRTMSQKFSNVAMMCGAKKRQIVAYVLLPGAMPSIVNGIRVGAAYAWRGLIATEMIIASTGIGWMIVDARSWLNTETVILGAIVIGVLWLGIDRLLLKVLEAKTVEKWGMLRR